MRRALGLSIISAAALAACTAGPGTRGWRDLRPTANPSAVIAAELAFAREAQEEGQWTAFREFAADDAVMFVPQPVAAQDWLRRQADPPQAVRWQPHQVWSSCDGSLAVARGAWQRPDGTFGQFTTVWQREDNREYKWIVDVGGTLDEPLEAPAMIAAEVAECGVPLTEDVVRFEHDGANRVGGAERQGLARDSTLETHYRWLPTGGTLTVRLQRGGRLETVHEQPIAGSGG